MIRSHIFRWFGLLLAVVFGVSCTKEDPESPVDVPVERVVLLCLYGDNNLDYLIQSNAERTLEAVAAEGIPEEARLVVFHDRPELAELYECERSGAKAVRRTIETYDKRTTRTLDPEFLAALFRRVRTLYPADHYGVLLSSHGGGWAPVEVVLDAQRGSVSGFSPLSAPAGHPMLTKFWGQAGNDYLSIPDLAGALGELMPDYVVFDCCFMASVEALYELRRVARYAVASTAEVMGYGFPYREIVPLMLAEDLPMRRLCAAFMDYYRTTNETYRSGTISLIDCAALDELAEATRAIFEVAAPDAGDADGVQTYELLARHLFFDLEQYMERIGSDPALRGAFAEALDRAVLFIDSTPEVYSAYGGFFEVNETSGLTTFIPSAYPEWTMAREAYATTAWAVDTGALR